MIWQGFLVWRRIKGVLVVIRLGVLGERDLEMMWMCLRG
jgi:hypothetical protein